MNLKYYKSNFDTQLTSKTFFKCSFTKVKVYVKEYNPIQNKDGKTFLFKLEFRFLQGMKTKYLNSQLTIKSFKHFFYKILQTQIVHLAQYFYFL